MGFMKKSCLSVYKQDRLLEHFVSGSTALTAARLCRVNRKTAAYFFCRLREIIAFELEVESEALFGGEIEVDESYFGGSRKGRRGRGAAGKVPVFGLLKRGGKVYVKIIPDASCATLIPIIERKVVPDSIVYSDGWKGYNALDVSDFHYFRINHSQRFADDRNHINRCLAGPVYRPEKGDRKLLDPVARQDMRAYPRGRPNVTCADSMVFRRPNSGYI